MTVRFSAIALFLVALTGALACGGRTPRQVDPSAPSMVEIRNQSFYDVTIYVLRSGARFRLGTVSGNTTAILELPRAMAYPGSVVRFMADPIGGRRTPHSQEIMIEAGGTIVLTVPPWT